MDMDIFWNNTISLPSLFIFQMRHSVKPLLHTTGIVAKAHTGIVQLDCVGDKLLVSTMTKCAIVDLKRFVLNQIIYACISEL